MVTAIIVNYHCYKLTARAAASVLNDEPTAQVIVVDNSVDDVENRALRNLLLPCVECITNSENVGFGQACNFAYKNARYDQIFLINPDVFVLNGCLSELKIFLELTPQAGAVSPLVFWDRDQKWLLPPAQLPTPQTELFITYALRWSWFGLIASIVYRKWSLRCLLSSRLIKQRMLSGGVMLIKKEAIEASGGLFDPDIFMYYEDTDLCQRIQKNGFNLYLLPTAKAVHEWCCRKDKTTLSEVSRKYYFQKHYPDNLLNKFLRKKIHSKSKVNLPQYTVIKNQLDELTIPIPDKIKNHWVMELSPHPLFMPSLYFVGNSDIATVEKELWSRLDPGDYWVRISSLSIVKNKNYYMKIEKTT